MKKLVLDIDFTISSKVDTYENAKPDTKMIDKIKEYKKAGYSIVFYTARNMKTHKGDCEKIKEHTLPIIIDWLERHEVPFDEIITCKPWNDEGFYVDDNAIRPKEFLSKTSTEILEMLDKERDEQWR